MDVFGIISALMLALAMILVVAWQMNATALVVAVVGVGYAVLSLGDDR